MSLKILTIVGARPQIIKAAAISRCILNEFSDKIHESILHTGQHYDHNMSALFFEELDIPSPTFQLQVSGLHNSLQTANMLKGISEILSNNHFDMILVYGDTNSTLAGALAGAQHQIPVIHIEAGLRSYNKSMPEEVNRIITDHNSTFLFAPTNEALRNLNKEGLHYNESKKVSIDNPYIALCGDIMYDNALHYSKLCNRDVYKIKYPNPFILATVHRNFNTDNPNRLQGILHGLNAIAKESNQEIVLPLHPRTQKVAQGYLSSLDSKIRIIEPVSFLEMLYLEANSDFIVTDSGGVQKEAYFFKKKCIILRPETEWVEIVAHGSAILADADTNRIIEAYRTLQAKTFTEYPEYYGDGKAAQSILKSVLNNL